MAEVWGKGHEILACFDIEYEKFIKEITSVLMKYPDKKFKLTLEKIPERKSKRRFQID